MDSPAVKLQETNLLLALGAGLFWTSYLFRLFDTGSLYGVALGPVAHTLGGLFTLTWVVVICALCSRIGIRKSRLISCSIVIVLVAALLPYKLIWRSTQPVIAFMMLGLDYFTLATQMIFWALAFASLEKRFAAHNVISTVLIATLLFVAGRFLMPIVTPSAITQTYTLCSVALMLSGRIPLRNHKRERRPVPTGEMSALVGQRVLYGISLGMFSTMLCPLATNQYNVAVSVFVLIVLCACVIAIFKAKAPVFTMLPSFLFISMGSLVLVSMEFGFSAQVFALVSGIWLTWQTLSSVQLSDLKGRLGVSELAVTLADKVLIAAFFLVGVITCNAIGIIVDYGANQGPVATVSLVFFGILLLLACLILVLLITVRNEEAIKTQVESNIAEREEQVFAAIAKEYGLTPREQEVVEILADGHTSAYIADMVGASQNTIKAHIAHIYQKLNVHHKDEILEFIDAYAAQHANDLF